MQLYIAEFFGMFLLILLGNGIVANVCLEKSGMKAGGPVQICIGWGMAVMIPAFIFGATSGAHFNPVLTIALAADGTVPWNIVPGYVIAQMLGGFAAQFLVYAMYKDHFDATSDPETKFCCFATRPTIRNLPRNILCEAVATFVLVFAIKGIGQVSDIAGGLGNVYVFAIICSIGMSFGGLTGFAINPARDLGPRLAHTLIFKDKKASHWDYAIVPTVGPLMGALVAVALFHIIF